MSRSETRYYDFGPFRMDTTRRLLLRDGEQVALSSKAFDTLWELVRAGGEVVAKEDLLDRVWPDTVVEEKNLTVAVSALRKSLGETPQEHRYIVTMPGRGYRFVADVRQTDDDDGAIVLESHNTSRVVIEVESDDGDERLLLAPSVPFWRRRAGIALAFLVVFGAVAAVYSAVWRRPESREDIHSLAVLPFKPLTEGDRDESLELGMADTLITTLSRQQSVTVRPISAVRRYAAVDQDALAAGHELQVEAVLEGNIQRMGDRVRVTVRLVRVRDGAALWATKLDEKFTDIFALQDAISERVAKTLAVELTGSALPVDSARSVQHTDAYIRYLKGRYFWSKRTRADLLKSIEYFTQAIEVDKEFAPAYAGLADAYHSMVYWEAYPPKEFMPKAREAAEKALALDDSLSEAHTSLAIVLEDYEWRFADAEAEYRKAIALNPNYAFGHQRFGQLLMESGRFDEARVECERALEIDPVSLDAHMTYAALFYFERQYDQAVDQLRRTIELAPDYGEPYGLLGVVYYEKGMYQEAIDAFLHFSSPDHAAVLRQAFTNAGIEGFLRKDVELALQSPDASQTTPIFLAVEYAYLGERDKAFAILERAYEQRHSWLGELRVEPAWDNLRADPRFADLVRRVGLTP